MLEQATGDATWVNRRSDYDRMLDALTVAKATAGVKNTATAFGLLLDLAEKFRSRPRRQEIARANEDFSFRLRAGECQGNHPHRAETT